MSVSGAAPTGVPTLHATLVAARRDGRWCGVLLQGPSGSGKSDLALRALAAGWRLAADDRVRVWASGGVLYGAAPAALTGLVEVRGLGVTAVAPLSFVRLAIAVDAPTRSAEVQRMPDVERLGLFGIELPRLRLAFRDASAVAKLDHALDAALRRRL